MTTFATVVIAAGIPILAVGAVMAYLDHSILDGVLVIAGLVLLGLYLAS